MTSLLALLLNGSLCWAGSISGRVTDTSNGLGLQGIKATCFQGNMSYSVRTGVNGYYTITNIPDGSCKVAFYDDLNYKFVTQWYNNTRYSSGAEVLSVTSSSNHTGINAALIGGGIISGSVTNIQTNEPVWANVRIYSGFTNTLVDEFVSSNGTYKSNLLLPGTYTVHFSTNEAYDSWYNQAPDQQSSALVTVTAFHETTGINAAIVFLGRITGKVTDTSGVGISNITTTIYDAVGNAIDSGYTDGNGNYITPPLLNGDYKICFNGWNTYESRCYSNALDISGATPITVTAPSTSIANIQLRRYVTISGAVHTSGGTPFTARVQLYDPAQKLVEETYSSPYDGIYTFGNNGIHVVEGNYKVRFSDMNVGYAEQWYPAKSDFAGAATIAAFVPATTGIDAVMKMVGKISGQVVNNKGVGLPNIAVTVFDDSQNTVANLATDGSGYYRTDYLPEGNYRVRFDGTASGYPLTWYSGQPDFAHATPVAVVINGVSGINATLVSPLKISGKLTNSSGAGVSAWVYIYDSQNNNVTSCKSDVTGTFVTGELPVGSYRIKTTASGYPEQWYGGADFASATAVNLSLSSGPVVTNIALKEDGGRIYGRVTNSSGVGIDGVFVYLYNAANGSYLGYTNTDTAGNYFSGKLSDGSYQVKFMSPFTGHLEKWYDNKGDITTATAIAVTAATPAVGIDAMLLMNMTIAVTLNGSGDGAVNGNPPGLACTSGSCTAKYPENSQVKLSATPGSTSLFGGWGSACTNLSGDCTVVMTADKAVTATFTLAPKAKVGVNGYESLAAAYAAAGMTDTILALDTDMPDEGFIMGSPKSITLKCGYKTDYLGKSGLPTVLKGLLTISSGSLTVEGLVVE